MNEKKKTKIIHREKRAEIICDTRRDTDFRTQKARENKQNQEDYG